MIYELHLKMDGCFPGAPDHIRVKLKEHDYDNIIGYLLVEGYDLDGT